VSPASPWYVATIEWLPRLSFVDEKVALTYRCYDAAEYEIGIIVQDGNAEYEEIVFTK